MLFLCCVFLFFSFVWPFIGGYREMKLGNDPLPLYINMDYLKNPRYFSLSFREFFENIKKDGIGVGLCSVQFSKMENVDISENTTIKDNNTLEDIVYVKDNLSVNNANNFLKEVYVLKNAEFGNNNIIRALACDGNLVMQKQNSILRWLDVTGSIKIGDECNLGLSVTSDSSILVGKDCSFKRLYGFPVSFSEYLNEFNYNELSYDDAIKNYFLDSSKNIENDEKIFKKRDLSKIPNDSYVNCDVITEKSLVICEKSTLFQHVKTYGSLVLENNVTVYGNVFAEDDVCIGENCRIFGNIFTQGEVILGKNTVVGSKGKIKSVVGNTSIKIHSNATVYGFLSTEGEGYTL